MLLHDYPLLPIQKAAVCDGLRYCDEEKEGCRSNSYFVFSITQRQPPSAGCDIAAEKKGFAFFCGKSWAGSDAPLGRHSLPARSNPFFSVSVHKNSSPPSADCHFCGGEEGIRTLEPFYRLHDFQSCALDQTRRLLHLFNCGRGSRSKGWRAC